MSDGGPLYGQRRQVTIERTSRTTSGYNKIDPEKKYIVPDDGIIHYEFTAEENAQHIKVRVGALIYINMNILDN